MSFEMKRKYTEVPVSVLVQLPGPPLRDLQSVLIRLSVLLKYE